MRSDWRWLPAIAMLLALAAAGAKSYARVAAPGYRAIASILALGHPWEVQSVEVAEPPGAVGAVLRLKGLVYESRASLRPSFRMTGKLQVAAAAQAPLIFGACLYFGLRRPCGGALPRCAWEFLCSCCSRRRPPFAS